jgi:hypothetical protein
MDPFNKSGCSTGEYWKQVRTNVKTETKSQLEAGVEPDREYLTQPPKGYMAPKANVKATFEPRNREEEDPRDFFRKKQTAE